MTPAQIWPIPPQGPREPPAWEEQTQRARLLAAWLKWAVMGHNEEPEGIYGSAGAHYIRRLLSGEDVPMPPKLRARE